jgi:AcrR family transcriptional regulator
MAATFQGDRETARHISRAATRLFAERGYEATPIRLIIEEAQVAKPTLYHHFGSKEGLAHAVLIVPMTGLVESLQSLLETRDDPLRRLEAMAEAYFAFAREDPDRTRFVYALFFGPAGSALACEIARFAAALDRTFAAAVGKAAEAGLVAAGRAGDCTTALRGLIVVHTLDFLYRGRELGSDLAGRVVHDLMRGFGQRTARRPARAS